MSNTENPGMDKFLKSLGDSMHVLAKTHPTKKRLKLEVGTKDSTYIVEITKK